MVCSVLRKKFGGPSRIAEGKRAFLAVSLMVCGIGSAPVSAQLEQIYYVPLPGEHIRSLAIGVNTLGLGNTTAPNPDTVRSVVSLSANVDGTVIFYDHWEDGYEDDLANPVQASTQTFNLEAGDFQVLENNTFVNPRDPATILFDGRDRIGANEQIAVTRAGWRLQEGTLLAGAAEVFNTKEWNDRFEFPVGIDIATNASFQYTAASVMAGETGAIFAVDLDGDGSVDNTITLLPGESILLENIETGGTMFSTDPLQVHLLTGDVGSNYEARWYSLIPSDDWGSSYYSPVGTAAPGIDTTVLLYNPGSAAISVTEESLQANTATQSFSNTTPGAVSFAATPCAAPLTRTFNVGPSFTVLGVDLGLNVDHIYRGDVQGTLQSPAGPRVIFLGSNGGDANDNYDVRFTDSTGNPINDGGADNTAAPFYDRDAGPSNSFAPFSGESSAGTWTLELCDVFSADNGTFNRAELRLTELVSQTPTSSTLSVPAGGLTEFTVPLSSGAHFFTASNEPFFALALIDFDGTAHDWGFTLLPEEGLSTAHITGWAVGRDPTSGTNPSENGSPIWVTATGNTTLYVDYDGDPTTGALVDPEGNQYDEDYSLTNLESLKLFDTTDGDQSGALFYTLDGTLVAAAWGQDPATASAAAPGIDLGTTVLPLQAIEASKGATLLDDADGNGGISAGDTVLYEILVTNASEAVVVGATVTDFGLDPNVTYLADSTEIDGVQVPDDVAPATIFPLDEGGLPLANLGIDQTVVITFAVQVADPLPPGVNEFGNQVRVATATDIETGSTVTPIRTPSLQITKTSDAVGDVVAGQTIEYTVTVSNISTAGTTGIRLLDSLPAGTSYVAESTEATGFNDVLDGTLTLEDAPAGGVAINGSTSCGGGEIVRTFTVGQDVSLSSVDLGFNAAHTWRGDIRATLESPAGTRVQVITEDVGDSDNGYDMQLEDGSANPIDDGFADNTAAPFYDRTAGPSNAFSAFNGENGSGTWRLEICDTFTGSDNGTYNRARLRLTGTNSTAVVRTNQAADADPLLDGDPTHLLLAPDGFGLLAGQSMTVTYSVLVEDPLDPNTTNILNTAIVTSLEQDQPLMATVVDPVSRGVAIGDYVWLDVDGDGFQDVVEPGLGNVTVRLFDPGGDGAPGGGDDTLIATTVTDTNGAYLFDHLPAGSYYVDVDQSTLPSGLATSPGTSDPSAVVTLAAEEIFLDADFGYTNASAVTAILGDYVWSDADGDGIQDPGEPGIGGVTVELLDAAGMVVSSVVTSDDGRYLFSGVAAGEYRVRVAASNLGGGGALDGYTVTTGPQSEGAELSAPVTLLPGSVVTDVDFGYRDAAGTYSITNSVWLDLDDDGAFDPSEEGIAEVTVDLLDASGDVIATTRTALDGTFSFTGVEPGSYTLQISDNTGELIGLAGTTAPGRVRSLAVTVVAADLTGVDFGYNGPATLGDRVWSDADGDGIQDPNEVGLAGVTVELLDGNGAVITTAVTDANGNYLFDGIAPDGYSVRVDAATLPAGFTQTGDPDATLDGQGSSLLQLGEADLALDFGYRNNALADISGNVFSDLDVDGVDDGLGEPGFLDVTLALLDASGNVLAVTKTDAAGDYEFPDLPPGSYQVAVTDTGGVLGDYQLTSGLDTLPVTLAATDITGIDFGYARNGTTGSIGDFVWLDADRDGVQDAGESGLSGVSLELYDTGPDGAIGGGDDSLLATTTTDANGGYVFSGLPPGSYYVDVVDGSVPAGLVATTGTTDPSSVVLLSAGELETDVDFGYGGTNGSSALGDHVWADADGDGVQDPGEIGIGGVTVSAVGPSGTFSTVTADDGSYLFTGLAPGTYTVTVDSSTLPAAFDSVPTNGPASRELEVPADADVLTADFGFDGASLGSIGDLVWLDVDGDGVLDAGEKGIAGVTLNLLDADGDVVATVTTDTAGAYDFTGLPAGTFRVEVSDVGQILRGLGLSAGTNPTAPIALAAGQDYDLADFPYAPSAGTGTIGSIVWHDLDGDGQRDPGESGLGGVTVALWHDVDGNGVIEPGTDNLLRSLTTDDNGEYEFVGLAAGDYLVDVTDTAGVLTGFTKTTGAAGVDDNSQADPYAVTLSPGSLNDVTADFGYQASTPQTISGTVFGDEDRDAALDLPEDRFAGIPVILYLDLDGDGVIDPGDPVIGTTTSNGTGGYLFTDLPDNRDYIVAVETTGTAIDGFVQTTQTVTGGIQPVSLAGSPSAGNDFGFDDDAPAVIDPAVIGDRVWLDVDGDGVQDIGEPGIPNVDLEIYDVGADGAVGGGDDLLLGTTTTDSLGGYSFGGLAAGTYYVDVIDASVPAGLSLSPGSTDPTAPIPVALGDVFLDADFGYRNATSDAVVGNYVWSDADGDGLQDPGEPGIGGVTVELVSAGADGVLGTGDDVVEDTAVTSDDGWYLFTGVAPGEYAVDVDTSSPSLAGYTLTSGPQSQSDPTLPFTVAAGDTYLEADFGFQNGALFSVADRLWHDLDGGQTQDPGEPGLPNVTIALLDASGDVIATTTTDANGDFSFDGLENGSYTLSVTDTTAELREFVGTTAPAVADQLAVTVAGADVSAVSFGYNIPGQVGDTVWSDANGNGVQDPGEPGIGGVTVELWQDADGNGIFDTTVDTLIGTRVTDGAGQYLFSGVPQGTFFVSVDDSQPALAAYTATTTDQEGGANAAGTQIETSLATSAASFLDADFGYRNNALPNVSGNVFEDDDRDGVDDGAVDPGIGGVTVALVDSTGRVVATTTTDVNGDYSFLDVAAGDYTVTVTDEQVVLGDYFLTSGLDAIGITVVATDLTDLDFGYARDSDTGSIGDFVWHDADRDGVQDGGEPGLAGIALDLYDAGPDGMIGGGDDVLLASTTTGTDGQYLFPSLGAGTYYVDLDASTLPTGLAATAGTTDPSSLISLSEGEAYDEADFGFASAVGSAIGDTIWLDADGDGEQGSGELGIAGVTVELRDSGGALLATATTDANGRYLFPGLAAADYEVTVDVSTLPAGVSPVPTNIGDTVITLTTNGTTDALFVDWGFTGGTTGSIGDTVFLDLDGDGILDGGEPGLGGVTLDLLDSGGNVLATAITDENGAYDFTGLLAGTYRVRVSDTGGVLQGLNLSAGTNPTSDIVLTAGQDYDLADFPYAPSGGTGTIGNRVWHDQNNDGVRQSDEPGFEGVSVDLWLDVDNDGVITPGTDNLLRTEFTDTNGEYEFNALPESNYLVTVSDSSGVLAGFTKTSGTAGVDDNSQADPYAVTLTVGSPNDLTADFGYYAAADLSISGTTFFDLDSDGLYEPSTLPDNDEDFGVNQLGVFLFRDLDGDGALGPRDVLIDSRISDGSGDYLFANLPPGDYLVAVDAAGTFVDGGIQTTQLLTASIQPVTLVAVDSVDNDFGFSRPALLALVSKVEAYRDASGVVVSWRTTAEAGSAGFLVYRETSEGGWLAVHPELVPALDVPQGGLYRVRDERSGPSRRRYWIAEIQRQGVEQLYGPFGVDVTAAGATSSEPWAGPFEARPLRPSGALLERLRDRELEKARVASASAETAETAEKDIVGGRVVALKLRVREPGLYHLGAAEIAAGLGQSEADVQRYLRAGAVSLTRGGEAVAWRFEGGGLRFVGWPLGSSHTETRHELDNVYRLELGGRGTPIETTGAGSPPGAVGGSDHSEHFEEDVFAATFVARDPDLDFWHWRGLFAGHPTAGQASFELPVHAVDPTAPARLTVHLRGASDTSVDGEHHAVVEVGGETVGEVFFDGLDDAVATFDLDPGLLSGTRVEVVVSARLDTGADRSLFYVDAFDLQYRRFHRAADDLLLATLEGRGPLTAEGFSSADLRVFDVSDRDVPREVSDATVEPAGDGTFRVGFDLRRSVGSFLVLGAPARTPVLEPDYASSLRSPANRADYLIVTRRDLVPAAEQLARYRSRDGFRPLVVALDDVMDEFNHGLLDPKALRRFLAHAWAEWAEAPTHVLLAGAGHYDTRDLLGLGDNLVPPLLAGTPFGLYAADTLFGDVAGDALPEIKIGRLPVVTGAELLGYLAKLERYEAQSRTEWARNLVLGADDPDEGGDFVADSEALLGLLPSGIDARTLYLGEQTLAEVRQGLFDAVASGVGLVNLVGHGGLDRFTAEGFLTLDDVPLWQNPNRLPLVASLTCNVARFEVPGFVSLGEELVLSPEGGAIAVFAPTGLSLGFESHELDRALVEAIYRHPGDLGDMHRRVLQRYLRDGRYDFMLRIYQLLGDPAAEPPRP